MNTIIVAAAALLLPLLPQVFLLLLLLWQPLGVKNELQFLKCPLNAGSKSESIPRRPTDKVRKIYTRKKHL